MHPFANVLRGQRPALFDYLAVLAVVFATALPVAALVQSMVAPPSPAVARTASAPPRIPAT